VDADLLEALLGEGFVEYYARWALHKCDNDAARARHALKHWGSKTRDGSSNGSAPSMATEACHQRATFVGADRVRQGGAPELPAPPPEADVPPGAGGLERWEVEDEATEAAVAAEVQRVQRDPLSCYDVDIRDEEVALQELHAWLLAQPSVP
jgi:hypothetical protein